MSIKNKILIIDDNEENRRLLINIIKDHMNHKILVANNGASALKMLKEMHRFALPDIILLDIMMPEMDGFTFAAETKKNPLLKDIPIIFITALNDPENKIKGLRLGGVDYITKPFHHEEVITRVTNHLKLKNLINNLENIVQERTYQIEKVTLALVNALINANYYNDDETGNHIKRVAYYSEVLAKGLHLSQEFINQVSLYAPLHDIGKVGIPDSILKKPGKLTPEEFEHMKRHSEIGYKMINDPAVSPVVKNIVLHHHEKWNGQGYPQKLEGDKIPIEARIVAIADVYDALRSKRVYKEAFSIEKSNSIILESSGTHFDPSLIEVFRKNMDTFAEIFIKYGDTKEKEE